MLLIFSVKELLKVDNEYYSNGGFGKWMLSLQELCPEPILLCCHVKNVNAAPTSFYKLNMRSLDSVRNVRILKIPYINDILASIVSLFWFVYYSKRAKKCIVRIPDFTGLLVLLVSDLFSVDVRVMLIDDWRLQLDNLKLTHKGLKRVFLTIYLGIYCFMEKIALKNKYVFFQSYDALLRYRIIVKIGKKFLSSSIRESDIVARQIFRKSDIRVLNIGRMVKVKNQMLILDWVKIYQRTELGKLTLIGDGPNFDLINESGSLIQDIVSFEMIKNVNHGPELWEYFDGSDIFILASLSEGTPKVVLEAMCRGCIVIVPFIAGLKFYIEDGHNAFVYEVNNVASLNNAFDRMLQADLFVVAENAKRTALENTITASTSLLLR